jgi:hypothetical protein
MMITGLSLNLLRDSWEVTVYTQTEEDLAAVVKFAEEEGLNDIWKMSNNKFCVMIPKKSVSKFCDKFICSQPNNDILPH